MYLDDNNRKRLDELWLVLKCPKIYSTWEDIQ